LLIFAPIMSFSDCVTAILREYSAATDCNAPGSDDKMLLCGESAVGCVSSYGVLALCLLLDIFMNDSFFTPCDDKC
jgi:hypothetical protein